jgi:hypothetical protein
MMEARFMPTSRRNFAQALARYEKTAQSLGVHERVIRAEVAKLRDYKARFIREALRVHRGICGKHFQ